MTKPVQLPLQLSYREAFGREEFLVSDGNMQAVAWIDTYPTLPQKSVLIYGPARCGKTHLATVFSDKIYRLSDLAEEDLSSLPDKFVVENIDDENASETFFFHLLNFIKEHNSAVIFTARKIPDFKMPEVQSRIALIPTIQIRQPDDFLMMSLLCKFFQQRHVLVESDVISYLMTHLARSFDTIFDFVEKADRQSLCEKRKLTIPLCKKIIENSAHP